MRLSIIAAVIALYAGAASAAPQLDVIASIQDSMNADGSLGLLIIMCVVATLIVFLVATSISQKQREARERASEHAQTFVHPRPKSSLSSVSGAQAAPSSPNTPPEADRSDSAPLDMAEMERLLGEDTHPPGR